MNGIIGNEKGVLLKYAEFEKMFEIPEKYILRHISQISSDIIALVSDKEEEYTLKQNFLDRAPDCGSASIMISREEFQKKLKVDFKCFGYDFYCKDGDKMIGVWGTNIAYLKLTKNKNLYVWIYEDTRKEKYFSVQQ